MDIKEDKVNFFAKVIYEKIDEENKNALELFKAEKESKLLEFRTKSEKKRRDAIAEAEKKARFKSNEIVSNERSISRHQAISLMENLIQETVESLKNELMEFVKTSEYEVFLLDMIERSFPKLEGYHYYLYITDGDFKRHVDKIEELLALNSIDRVAIRASSRIDIGGFIFEEKEKRFALDNSFVSLIEDMRPHIGLKVSEVLRNGGETVWKTNAER